MNTNPHIDMEAALADASWARALARSLVGDAHRADDLVQRAWLAALEHPPRPEAPLRHWLSVVMRNFVRTDARAAARRSARERAWAPAEARAAEQDAIEIGVTVQQRLLQAVHELPESYRSVVWARYFEGLPPREIAQREGVPLKTVKTRLSRGLERLRERLDREHDGDRGTWVLALLPLMDRPSWWGRALAATAANVKLTAACALALLGIVIGVWSLRRGSLASDTELVASADVAALSGAETQPNEIARLDAAARGTQSNRTALEVAQANPSTPATTATPRWIRVVDTDMNPRPGLAIATADSEPILSNGEPLVTDVDGRVDVSVQREQLYSVRDREWVTVFAASLGSFDPVAEPAVIVAPRQELSGVVVDQQGVPIAGAKVLLHPSEAVRNALGRIAHAAAAVAHETASDPHGQFELRDVPLVATALVVNADGYLPHEIELPAVPHGRLNVELARSDDDCLLVRGRVIDERGSAVAGAHVALADGYATALADGSFALAARKSTLVNSYRHEPGPELRALTAGRLPARLALPPLEELAAVAKRETFELVIGGPALAIEGRVVDDEGRPLAGVLIQLSEQERFGEVPQDREDKRPRMVHFESLIGGRSITTSDERGRFELSGLIQRDYQLDATSVTLMVHTQTPPIRAGSKDVEIVVKLPRETLRVAGRVVDTQGRPVAGATAICKLSVREPSFGIVRHAPETGSDGRFVFENVPAGKLAVEAQATGFIDALQEIGPGEAHDALEVRMLRAAYLQVDLGARSELADGFRLIDEDGREVRTSIRRHFDSGTRGLNAKRVPIDGGRSAVVVAPENARTLVLVKGENKPVLVESADRGMPGFVWKGEEEVARIEVRLVPGQTVVIRP